MLKILSYVRSVLGVPLFILWTVLLTAIAFLISLFTSRGLLFISTLWFRGILFYFNAHVQVLGTENLPKEPTLFIFNHKSLFDIPFIEIVLRGYNIRFGAKAEMFKIPLFGRAMRGLGTLEIHRGDRERVLALYKKSLKNVNQGINYVLAPEGTRHVGEGLKEFKSGPFLMAIAGQLPITPVVIHRADEVLPKGRWIPNWGVWKSLTFVSVLPPVETKGCDSEDRHQLKQKCYDSMLEALAKGPREH